jgi:hypothetical protein
LVVVLMENPVLQVVGVVAVVVQAITLQTPMPLAGALHLAVLEVVVGVVTIIVSLHIEEVVRAAVEPPQVVVVAQAEVLVPILVERRV